MSSKTNPTEKLFATADLPRRVRDLYDTFGQRKPMGLPEPDTRKPLFFLNRQFLGDQDLLMILNTRRCRYQCHFCSLPAKSPTRSVSSEEILAQFEYVLTELKHSLSVVTRLTLSNEGSLFDTDTFPPDALQLIVRCSRELRMVRRIVFETRIEFVDSEVLAELRSINPRATLDILTGFESHDPYVRDELLRKDEPLDEFLKGLDRIAASACDLTAYVLFKPSPYMTDEDAFREADASIDFIAHECRSREINLTIRLNPMYAAAGSKWADLARTLPDYQPPKLTEVMRLAERKAQQGHKVYIGISREGIDESWGSYLAREDYSDALIKPIKLFNDGKADALFGRARESNP